MSSELQIVIPMAGLGSRFANAGFAQPKPLIDVLGTPMIGRVVRNLAPTQPHRFIFIVRREHTRRHGLDDVLHQFAEDADIVELDTVTEGAACTVLTARDHLDANQPLMLANCDQWLDIDIDDYLADSATPDTDGLIMTMPATDPKWSFVRLDGQGFVTEVAEKRVISNCATVGIYNFATAGAFIAGAESMIRADERVNGEFYVAPVYNELIKNGARIRTHDIADAMWGLGTPADLAEFTLAHGPRSSRFTFAG